jgi:hypothetical protein
MLDTAAVEALVEATDGCHTLGGWLPRLALEARLKWNEGDRRVDLNVPEA